MTDTVSAKSLCCGMGVVSDIKYVTGENLTELNNKTGKTTLQPLPNLSCIINQLEGKYSELKSSSEYEKLRLPQTALPLPWNKNWKTSIRKLTVKEHLRITPRFKLSLTAETNELTQSRTTRKGGLGCVYDLHKKKR